jgi:hypothetical protein
VTEDSLRSFLVAFSIFLPMKRLSLGCRMAFAWPNTDY